MSLADRVIVIARSQLGVIEATGRNDGLPALRYAGGRVGEPWCAHFVAWCFRQADRPLPGDVPPTPRVANPLCSVARMERILEEHEWLRRVPEPGDIVFFLLRGISDAGNGRHVGLVETVNTATLTTIEGNSANGVHRRSYLRARIGPVVTSYGRVPDLPGST